MCGIVGIFGERDAFTQIQKALRIMEKRGKEGFGLADGAQIHFAKDAAELKLKGKALLGHTLHAVVDFVPQPLRAKGTLVANCEIYNWQELNQKYNFQAQNDAEMLLHFLDQFGVEKLGELDGVYAFIYWRGDEVYLARDLLGEKPLWFSYSTDGLAAASEKKALEAGDFVDVQELNPRQILKYSLPDKKLDIIHRKFFSCLLEHQKGYEEMKQETKQLLQQALEKRIPEKKMGLLFSGGVDSAYLALMLKKNNIHFTCYTAVVEGTAASDLAAAEKAARILDLPLRVVKVKINQIPYYLKEIVPLIEDSNVVKVGVALPFYTACELAKKDGCKVIFSGLGSEEIFAGYERHKNAANVNKECVSGLLKMYERDLYRDDVVTMANSMELRLPFLDLDLVKYVLKIPGKYKLKGEMGKFIFREIAQEEGLPTDIAWRKKTAAQYGSKFDYALGKLAKKNGFASKSAYLRTFYPSHNLKLGVLYSSGKDSNSAAYIMQKQNYELTCLITLRSKNEDSYMFQSAGVELVELQAKALGLPVVFQETSGEKEEELKDLEKAIRRAKEIYQIDGIVTGALFSTYQRDRIEKIGDALGLKVFSPLWHKPQEQHLREVVQNGFTAIIIKVAAEGLTKEWLGRKIDEKFITEMEKLNKKVGLNVAGEGGEYETAVLDGQLFKEKIVLDQTEMTEEHKNRAILVIKKARLEEK